MEEGKAYGQNCKKYENAKSTFSTVTWSLFLVVVFFALFAVMQRIKTGTLTGRTIMHARNETFLLIIILVVAASAFFTFLSNVIVNAICDHVIELHLVRVKMWNASVKSKETKEVQNAEAEEVKN